MRIVIVGTPGTGKTPSSRLLAHRMGLPLHDVNKIVKQKRFYTGEEKGSLIVDLDALASELASGPGVLDGHVLVNIPLECDYIFVLRTHPNILKLRLQERKWTEEKVKENVEAEALDYCTVHTLDNYPPEKVFEIDTGHLTIAQIVDEMQRIIAQKPKSNVGKIDWSGYFL